ncbi:alkyl/aryl-sulfatase [Hydrogenophaga sp.]|uniref:alkyl/aryl-sulfatase n=1 Tax=Hydrogenophaga sp. TaxID=1904254 RepID=UPI00286E483C|nr:alkyl sulfatase dimerization domain-containing protein [Hydrogenophaga sp.]
MQPLSLATSLATSLPARPATEARQREVLASLDFDDRADFDAARRGFVGTIPDAQIKTARGFTVWDLAPYRFLDEETAPPTVNPSLWRMSRLNAIHGLFKVTERIYQVRGFDIANITFIEGDTGLIVIDPLTCEESAAAALALYRQHRGDQPVRCVIYSHSHADHYGGVRGVIGDVDVREGRVQVIAPEKFLEEAVSENVLCGVPMGRRSQYQFGTFLAPGPRGHVDSGLGKAMGRGTQGLIPPTRVITQARERHVIDGVAIEFQLTPGAEAPAEMNFHFPQLRALNLAENACHTLHNLCPLRGAKTRDALAWSRYLDEALTAYVPQVDVVFAQHHWPLWGQETIHRFVAEQRDLYRFLHDQTLRLMSHGLTATEIAEQMLLPRGLASRWHARGYYGAIVHNVQAIYAHYMGPYDGNPFNLHRLPPAEGGQRYVESMGGIDAVVERARQAVESGDFRWAVQLMGHAVFAHPERADVRSLAAEAMEQLGYQAESATWRNAYLLGASELRQGVLPIAGKANRIAPDVIACLPVESFLDYLAIRVRGADAAALSLRIDWFVADEAASHRLTLSNGALSHGPGRHGEAADLVVRATRSALAQVLRADSAAAPLLTTHGVDVQGDEALWQRFLACLDTFEPGFSIVTP